MKGFIAKGIFGALNSRFGAETGKTLADGMQILFRCKVSYHAVFGLSLNLIDIEPGFSLGEMARMRKETIDALRRKGLFELNKQKNLPLLPRRLAIVSVVSSKGYRDFISVLESSSFSKSIRIKLYPALLQGDAAVESICTALRIIAASARDYDAVAIIRGGGGETGLDCYDQYPLAEAVSQFPIPVLSGIGHATNLTVVEQVSHTNLITPTDLARWLIGRFQKVDDQIADASRRLSIFRKGKFELLKRDLAERTGALAGLSQQLIRVARNRLNAQSYRVGQQSKDRIAVQKVYLYRTAPVDLRKAYNQIDQRLQEDLKYAEATLATQCTALFRSSEQQLDHMEEKLELLKPDRILKRGYSITLANGKPIKNAADVENGTLLETQTSNGIIYSKATRKHG